MKITTFLMFEGRAEEAMNYYLSVFDNSEIIQLSRFGPNDTGEEGKVSQAIFSLNGKEMMCFDSVIHHDFTFTPSISMFVTCDTEEQVDRYFEQLSQDGFVLMPLGEYPFSKKFAWVSDKFGVSWQLSLAASE